LDTRKEARLHDFLERWERRLRDGREDKVLPTQMRYGFISFAMSESCHHLINSLGGLRCNQFPGAQLLQVPRVPNQETKFRRTTNETTEYMEYENKRYGTMNDTEQGEKTPYEK